MFSWFGDFSFHVLGSFENRRLVGFFSFLFSLYEGEHRVYGADGRWDTKRLGLPHGQKYDQSWRCEWLVDVLRASNQDKNEFPFHVASSTTKRCLWDLLGFTTFLDISNQHRDIRSQPFTFSNTFLPCSVQFFSSICLSDLLTFFFETQTVDHLSTKLSYHALGQTINRHIPTSTS